MLGKIIKYTFFLALALFVLFFAGSFVAGYYLGTDIETVSEKKWTARRDQQGVWEVTASSQNGLWSAYGFLQSQDRYFQLELTRHAALGRLSELFGSKVLGRDRLARQISAVALKEFKKISEDSEVKVSAASFVQGVEKWRSSVESQKPVEFRFLGFEIKDLPKWEPWHVYAISYYQAWAFSYDLSDELRDLQIQKTKGEKWKSFFDVKSLGDLDSSHLYSQDWARPSQLTKPKNGFGGHLAQVDQDIFHELGEISDSIGPWIKREETRIADYGRISNDVQLGASNAWIGYAPKSSMGPILCNDPHLQMSWPSALYPIKFALKRGSDDQKNILKGAGWMLSGQPFLVMGTIGSDEKSKAWGITLANYANTQERVVVQDAELKSALQEKVLFKVRDSETQKVSEVSFEERWTPRGPVATEWFEAIKDDGQNWALDWVGFRGFKPPYEFFLQQNFLDEGNFAAELSAKWQMPAVNVHWIEKNLVSQKSSWGHMVTGVIFQNNASKNLSPRFSYPKDRSFYQSSSNNETDTVFVASGNQQIWQSKVSSELAEQWGTPIRAKQILKQKEKNFLQLGFSQIDDHSMLTSEFVKWARRSLKANELCTSGETLAFERCQDDLSKLDAWTGRMDASDWRPTLASLWIMNLKWRLWLQKESSIKREEIQKLDSKEIDLFVQWARSSAAQRLLYVMLKDASFESELKSKFGLNLKELLKVSFEEAQASLELALGADRNLWSWGNLHRVAWQHPLLKALGPNLPFLGPAMSGADDAPLRASSEWDPRFPLLFPVIHGAVQRTCFDFSGSDVNMKWTAVSGPSGNPFSKWSQSFSREYYFLNKWVDETFFKKAKESAKNKAEKR